MSGVSFDFSGMSEHRIGAHSGLSRDALAGALATMDHALQKLRTEPGERGYIHIPDHPEVALDVMDYVRSVAGKFESVVILGIGGSSLGPRAVMDALTVPNHPGTLWNWRKGLPLQFLDNVDPAGLHAVLVNLNLAKTLFLVISKSGNTVETAAQLLVVHQMLTAQLGNAWKDHVVTVTDPKRGPLREITTQYGLKSFEIPPDVGGRFSVLSPVGLLPAALGGADISALLEGAKASRDALFAAPAEENPAAMSAAIHYLYHKAGRPIRIIMPYRQSLVALADWFLQLWGESLGKSEQAGSTPVRAVGVTDQHSQLQLYKEGPQDKVINFWRVEGSRAEVSIPQSDLCEAFAYLGGKSMTELLKAEYLGTRTALMEANRPTMEMRMAQLDEKVIGALLFAMELETDLGGFLYQVNAFDQPGVELGKQFAFGLLRRKGFEDFRQRFEAKQGLLPGWIAGIPL